MLFALLLAASGASGAPGASGASGAPPGAAGPEQPLTLPRCLELAVKSDPTLQAQSSHIAARQAAEVWTWAPYVPSIDFKLDANDRQDPLAGPFFSFFTPDASVNSQVLHGGIGVHGLLPTGTGYELGVDQSVGYYSSLSEALNPRIEPGLRLKLTQALWRGVSPTTNFAATDIAHARVSEAEANALVRRDQLMLDVSLAWLDVVSASALLQLREQSIDLANGFETLTRQRIEGGEQSALDLALALHTVGQRQVERQRALADRDDAVDTLAEKLHAPRDAVDFGTATFDAAPLARWPMPTATASEATQQASARSPILRRDQAGIDASRLEGDRAANAAAPDIHVAIEGNVRGLSGKSTCQGGYLADSVTPCGVDPSYQGGYDRAVENLAAGRFYSVGVVLEGSIPAWFGPAVAAGEGPRLEALALTQEKRAEEQRIASDAARLVKAVKERAQVLEAATRAVSLAQEALAAEETKLKGGRSTGFDLTRAQDLLIGARVDELSSRVALARAELKLRAAVGELGPENADLFP